jgi:SSS family solute:Na+ symporter
MATYVGSLSFLGGPAWAYTEGFAVIFIHINYPIAIFIVISVFLPFFYNSGIATIYEYLERRFGSLSRAVMSAIFLFGNIAYSGIMLYTTALVIEFITGMDVVTAIWIVSAIAVTYTMLGGISAVIWTDVIQSVVLLIGAIIVLVLLLDALPLSLWQTLGELKTAGKTNPFNMSTDPSKVSTIWTGIVAMSIYHVVVYGVNQMMVQRTLAAKSLGDAKKAYTLMGYAAFFIFSLFFSPWTTTQRLLPRCAL